MMATLADSPESDFAIIITNIITMILFTIIPRIIIIAIITISINHNNHHLKTHCVVAADSPESDFAIKSKHSSGKARCSSNGTL